MAYIVAIDGTAGCGKGSITKRVAEDLGLMNIDTGIIYRSIALAVVNKGLDLDEEQKIIDILKELEIKIKFVDGEQRAWLDGEDVSSKIRSKEVNGLVSQVSAIPEVRLRATEIIRNIASSYLKEGKSIIVEGRDIGTEVFPLASVKFYVDADIEVRAKRRLEQNREKNFSGGSYDEILAELDYRDRNDKNKKIGALRQADDAIFFDNTNYTLIEASEEIKKIIADKIKQKEVE